MTHSHYDDDYPERGRPRSKVGWTDHHETVLRALYWHTRTARLATDQSIYDCIVRFRGSVISPSGARTTKGVVRRLKAAGFERVAPRPEAFGVSADR